MRRQLFPDEGPPKYSGVNMWRGAVRWPAFLGGDTMVSTGWMTVGKTVIYPVRPGTPETGGKPLINWVAELERPEAVRQDWTGRGRLADMMPAFAGLKFDLLDITGMIEATEEILEYPDGRSRPAAALELRPHHPAGRRRASDVSARLQRRRPGDRRCALPDRPDQEARRHAEAALHAYEAVRNPATAKVVLTNRSDPPDAILREVWKRSGGKRFDRIEDVISTAELRGDLRPLQEGGGLRPRDAARRGRASSDVGQGCMMDDPEINANC